MNEVKRRMKFRKVKKNPPKTFDGKCPVCGIDSLSFVDDPNELPCDYYPQENTAELYLECNECFAEFTVKYSFKEIRLNHLLDGPDGNIVE